MATTTAPTMQRISVSMVGTTPLVMHNVRMANPLDPFTRRLAEFTSKRRKTIDDHEQIAAIEWEGSLYHSEDIGPYVPAEWIWKSLIVGGRQVRLGASIERGLLIDPKDRLVELRYDGPRDIDGLRADPRFRWTTSVNANPSSATTTRTMRTRPIFEEWSIECSFLFNEGQADVDRVQHAAELAGSMIGLGDGRRIGYGRYVAEVSQ